MARSEKEKAKAREDQERVRSFVSDVFNLYLDMGMQAINPDLDRDDRMAGAEKYGSECASLQFKLCEDFFAQANAYQLGLLHVMLEGMREECNAIADHVKAVIPMEALKDILGTKSGKEKE